MGLHGVVVAEPCLGVSAVLTEGAIWAQTWDTGFGETGSESLSDSMRLTGKTLRSLSYDMFLSGMVGVVADGTDAVVIGAVTDGAQGGGVQLAVVSVGWFLT